MISTKHNIINLIPANQCFFKHNSKIEKEATIRELGKPSNPSRYDERTTTTPLVCWAITETKDPKFTNATIRQIVGIYIDNKGELSVCEEKDDFIGYLHQPFYQLTINN